MISRRTLLGATLPLLALGINPVAFANTQGTMSHEPIEITVALKPNVKNSISRVNKSKLMGLSNCRTRQGDNRIPLSFRVNAYERYVRTPFRGDYTITLISGDFFSPIRHCDDIFIQNKSSFNVNTQVPLFKGEEDSYIRSYFYLVIEKNNKISISRLVIDPSFIFPYQNIYPIYTNRKTKDPTVMDRLLSFYESYSGENDILIKPKFINGRNLIDINVLIEE